MSMSNVKNPEPQSLPNGVMFNAYPDSIGKRLSDIIDMLERPEFRDAFSLFYILPTFFHSDLDRGFSIGGDCRRIYRYSLRRLNQESQVAASTLAFDAARVCTFNTG